MSRLGRGLYARRPFSLALVCAVVACGGATGEPATSRTSDGEPLPSWASGSVKSSLIDFVASVSTPGAPGFIAESHRVAVFDNDGTLWVEHPIYTQLQFALDRLEALAPTHPEWSTTEPFASALSGDLATVAASGNRGLMAIVGATHGGMTAAAFDTAVVEWIDSARHPRFGRRYTELVYQPQLELMAHLRAHGFRVFVVSGGGVAFMRAWTERVYGVPTERVVGSRMTTEYSAADGQSVIERRPELAFLNDGEGKPIGIYDHVGRQPILAFGNSDGDLPMLYYTLQGEGEGRRLALLLHHTDAEREYAYDRDTHVGRLDEGLDEGPSHGVMLVDMKRDWRRVFPFDALRGD